FTLHCRVSCSFLSGLYVTSILRPPLCSPLLPYTTLFRSGPERTRRPRRDDRHHADAAPDPGPTPAVDRPPRTTRPPPRPLCRVRSEEHTSELQSRFDLVCRLLLDKKHRMCRGRWGTLCSR